MAFVRLLYHQKNIQWEEKKAVEAGTPLRHSAAMVFASISLEEAIFYLEYVDLQFPKSEGCPSFNSQCCSSLKLRVKCKIAEHRHRVPKIQAFNHLLRCHIHFRKTSTCLASVLMGRKSQVLQMCKAQTTVKQVTAQINSEGMFLVKDGTNFVSSQGIKTGR